MMMMPYAKSLPTILVGYRPHPGERLACCLGDNTAEKRDNERRQSVGMDVPYTGSLCLVVLGRHAL